jgi:hypothetical protein
MRHIATMQSGATPLDNKVTIEVAISPELLSAVEEQSSERGESVSQFLCRGAETLLRRHKERRMLEQYVEARKKMPDSSEVNEARQSLHPGEGAT